MSYFNNPETRRFLNRALTFDQSQELQNRMKVGAYRSSQVDNLRENGPVEQEPDPYMMAMGMLAYEQGK
jgi:hypothetical protein